MKSCFPSTFAAFSGLKVFLCVQQSQGFRTLLAFFTNSYPTFSQILIQAIKLGINLLIDKGEINFGEFSPDSLTYLLHKHGAPFCCHLKWSRCLTVLEEHLSGKGFLLYLVDYV